MITSKKIRIVIGTVFALILMIGPVRILQRHYYPGTGFLRLIYFSKEYAPKALPEVQRLQPPTCGGYDGQYYAQVAIDPFLRRPDLSTALDHPKYRTKRVGLPLLAFLVGLGKAEWVLQAYALLNYAFWLVLLILLIYKTGLKRVRDFLLVLSLVWTTGTIASLMRSLPDLPALVLSLIAVLFPSSRYRAAAFLGVSALFREASLFSAPALNWLDGKSFSWKKTAGTLALVFLPIALWYVYSDFMIKSTLGGSSNPLGIPFVALVNKIGVSFQKFLRPEYPEIWYKISWAFEVLAPISLIIQAAYLIFKPKPREAFWRFGIIFAVAGFFYADKYWGDQYGYCRSLLPLTASFNLLVHKNELGKYYWIWYIAGNLGLCWLVTNIANAVPWPAFWLLIHQ